METMKDPLQVKYYERKLKRPLTTAEKNGEVPVTIGNNTFYLELTELVFPYDFMSRNQLFDLSKQINQREKL